MMVGGAVVEVLGVALQVLYMRTSPTPAALLLSLYCNLLRSCFMGAVDRCFVVWTTLRLLLPL
jgi:hypothetical protein